jgi:hypothetical protein
MAASFVVLDEAIAADDPVGVIDAFVDALDLAELGFSRVDSQVEQPRSRC